MRLRPLGNGRPSDTSQAVLAILNAGHRKGATVTRCEPPHWEVRHFTVYGPKVFAAIGGLPDTLTDRSLCLAMQRKTKAQTVARFLQAKATTEAKPINDSLIAWAESKPKGTVQAAYEELEDLEFLTDRDADLWMPLFAVCAVASPERIGELQRCALVLFLVQRPLETWRTLCH